MGHFDLCINCGTDSPKPAPRLVHSEEEEEEEEAKEER